MYAVIVTGGKQYRVSEGTVLKIERLEAEAGANVEFDQVLMIANGDKVTIVKFRRRKHYLRQGTHRQQYTEIKVTSIAGA